MLNALWKTGLIKRSPSDGLVLIARWEHQKIDKPRDGKYKSKEIKWMTWSDSENGRDDSTQGKDRIGSDTIGEDRKSCGRAQEPDAPPTKSPPEKKSEAPKERREQQTEIALPDQTPGSLVWESYSTAYCERYGREPIRNARVNTQLKNFVNHLPKDAAPNVAAFFVRHNDHYYVKNMHPVWMMLRDAEKLHTEWATGRQMTSAEAQVLDRRQGNINAFAAVAEKRGLT
jgi:hypothetical protein